jgi:hypothetical protein
MPVQLWVKKGKRMKDRIKVNIYGYWDEVLGSKGDSKGCGGCSSKEGGCGGCGTKKQGIELVDSEKSSCGDCGSKELKTTGQYYLDLVSFVKGSPVKDKVDIEFFYLDKINILDYDSIRTLDEFGYEAPYVVIDDIVRYYGGISERLIYGDILELVED